MVGTVHSSLIPRRGGHPFATLVSPLPIACPSSPARLTQLTLAIRHRGFTARYCEVKTGSIAQWKRGQFIKAGEVIAKVGKMYSLSMLH